MDSQYQRQSSCGLPCKVCTSHSQANPNRQYFRCVTCNAFCGWVDGDAIPCKDKSAGNNGGKRKGGCYKCGEDGHFARDCTAKTPEKKKRPKYCSLCQAEGHWTSGCPKQGELVERANNFDDQLRKLQTTVHKLQELIASVQKDAASVKQRITALERARE